ALAKLVADRLDAAWDRVRVVDPPTSQHYVNHKLLEDGWWKVLPHDHGRCAETYREATGFVSEFLSTMQITGGSASVRDAWESMRRAAVAARAMLMQAAAKRWNVDVAQLDTSEGEVVGGPSGATLSYGELARDAAREVPLQKVAQQGEQRPYRLIGESTARRDTPKKVNGTAKFGIDVGGSEMLYAAVRSAPTLSGCLANDPPAGAKDELPRVIKVDKRTVAVVAHSYWTAQRAVDRLPLTFTNPNWELSSK